MGCAHLDYVYNAEVEVLTCRARYSNGIGVWTIRLVMRVIQYNGILFHHIVHHVSIQYQTILLDLTQAAELIFPQLLFLVMPTECKHNPLLHLSQGQCAYNNDNKTPEAHQGIPILANRNLPNRPGKILYTRTPRASPHAPLRLLQLYRRRPRFRPRQPSGTFMRTTSTLRRDLLAHPTQQHCAFTPISSKNRPAAAAATTSA